MRTSERARERTATLLRRRWEQGYMSLDTFERRLDATFSAKDERQLARVAVDLPALGLAGRLRQWRDRSVQLRTKAVPVPLTLVTSRPVTLGRSRGSDIVLRHDTVSRAHAEIRREGDGWRIRDLGSTNGTWLAGHRVSEPEAVAPGDVLRLGDCAIRLL
jgi:hypothetical protein